MSKEDKIKSFNPNNPASISSNVFGLPFSLEESAIVLLPLPWEVTVSFSAGTASAPALIYDASLQVDLYDPAVSDAWKIGIYMLEENESWSQQSRAARNKAVQIIDMITHETSHKNESRFNELLSEINQQCASFKDEVKQQTLELLNQNKLVGGVGGDHSTPLGIIEALAQKNESFAILQLDAHADLRDAYEGFEYSHASIMFNALKVPQIGKLVQVGIRDYCQEEVDVMNNSNGRIKTFFDRDIKQQQLQGIAFSKIVEDIIKELPQKVYVSFDVDALDPKLCPTTGTPVAGGFSTDEILYLLESVVKAGKVIIGFDLNETGNHQWDANVSSRLLYKICNLMALSNGIK